MDVRMGEFQRLLRRMGATEREIEREVAATKALPWEHVPRTYEIDSADTFARLLATLQPEDIRKNERYLFPRMIMRTDEPLMRLQSLPLWHGHIGPNALEQALTVLAKSRSIYPVSLFADFIGEAAEPELNAWTQSRIARFNTLPALAVLQHRQMEPELRTAVEPYIEHPGILSSLASSVRYRAEIGKVCPWTEERWDDVLRPDEDSTLYGRAALVVMNGEPTALVKDYYEPSVLALRTLRDPMGRFPLVRGGVYSMPCELYSKIDAAGAGHMCPKFVVVDVPSMRLRPHRFLEEDVREELCELGDRFAEECLRRYEPPAHEPTRAFTAAI